MPLTYGRVSRLEAAAGILDFFVCTEQLWCTWEKLEESIAKIDYEKLSDEELGWFIEFIMNCCFRVWRSKAENPELNLVEMVKEEDDEVGFVIYNYDWKAFKFVRSHFIDRDLTSAYTIAIYEKELTPAEIKWLRSKCK